VKFWSNGFSAQHRVSFKVLLQQGSLPQARVPGDSRQSVVSSVITLVVGASKDRVSDLQLCHIILLGKELAKSINAKVVVESLVVNLVLSSFFIMRLKSGE